MLYIFDRIWNIIKSSNNKTEYEDQFKKKLSHFHEEIIQDEELKNLNKNQNYKKIQFDKNTDIERKCYKTTGLITSINGNNGVIDNIHIFNDMIHNSTCDQLKEGYKVEYLAYKDDITKKIRIIKIEKILDLNWDCDKDNEIHLEENNADIEYFDTHNLSVLGNVKKIFESSIIVDTDYGEIFVDSDKFPFVPDINDGVCLDSKVQTDENFVDLTGEIINVENVHPLRSQTFSSSITELNDGWGVVDDNCFFNFDILPTNYIPNIGDIVNVEVVENYKDKFVWRCTKISFEKKLTPLNSQTNKENDSDLFSNKNGIVVSGNCSFILNKIGEQIDFQIVVTNESNKPQKVLKSLFLGKKSNSQILLINPKTTDSFYINPKESYTFNFVCKAKFYGLNSETFLICFESGYKIGRKFDVNVEDYNNKRQLTKYNNAYLKSKSITVDESFDKRRFINLRFASFEIPKKLLYIYLSTTRKNDIIMKTEEMYPIVKETLSPKNYASKFGILLFLEEISFLESIKKYNLDCAHFTREKELLALEIEGLAEKRPSLIIGDSVKVSYPWAEKSTEFFEGTIVNILYNKILVQFGKYFHTKYNGEDVKIEFHYARSKYKKQHHSVRKVFENIKSEYLFPEKVIINKTLQLNIEINNDENLSLKEYPTQNIKWFNNNLNFFQKCAVKNILRGEARPMPYIIFGPPGTGKTMTLIEAILQIVTLVPHSRLLVGTSSNNSANLLTSQLIDSKALKPGEFIRLISHNVVEKDFIPDHLKQYCGTIDIVSEGTSANDMIITESGLKLKCKKKYLGSHRIIIGTCITLGTLLHLSYPKDHFTHVLIDEAGQCTEPETIVCITQIRHNNGQIILAGDPLQLGPIIFNKHASYNGLKLSLLSRILSCNPYKKGNEIFANNNGYDDRLVTKLIYNYRSIPSILKVFDDMFYDSELKPTINETDSNEIKLLWNLNKIFPPSEKRSINHGVFFISVFGENLQSIDSPSWYNAKEAGEIFSFLLKLYEKNIKANNIGIITPYNKQAQIIRNILIEAEVDIPKIGSIEEFQGQEKDIILISTVRSSKEFIAIDINYALGFVKSPKRLNVAISRSRSLLVIFGNSHLLIHDYFWKKLIKYCFENDAYIECK